MISNEQHIQSYNLVLRAADRVGNEYGRLLSIDLHMSEVFDIDVDSFFFWLCYEDGDGYGQKELPSYLLFLEGEELTEALSDIIKKEKEEEERKAEEQKKQARERLKLQKEEDEKALKELYLKLKKKYET